MVENSTPFDDAANRPQLWEKLLRMFPYQNATVSVTDLVKRHAAMGATEAEIAGTIEWSKDEQFIEIADEPGRLRLTPQGRRVWRETLGHA